MLLEEIIDKSILKCIDDVEQFVCGYKRSTSLSTSISTLLNNPKYQYNGKLYRGVPLPIELFKKELTIQQVQQRLMQNIQQRSSQMLSWSISLESMRSALDTNVASGDMYDYCFYVISQTGIGLDVVKVLHDHPFYDKSSQYYQVDNDMDIIEDEHEILAQLNNSVKLQGFMLWNNFYNINQFEEFKKQTKINFQIR